VGEPENRRQREAMRALMTPHVEEQVVCGEWFTPAKGMEDDGLAAVSGCAVVSRAARAPTTGYAERTSSSSPRRACWPSPLAGSPPRRRWSRARLVGDWPLAQVELTYRGRKAQSYFAHYGGTYTSKIVRATLAFDGDDRPLVIDFPDTPLARELLKAATAAIKTAR
jgi:hypothetical protein